MTRLIDADAFIEKLSHVPMVQEAIKKAMDTMPTVDAVPVVHGRWEYGENESGYDGYYCSKCFGHVRWYGKVSEHSINFIKKYNYCPNCGARMNAEREEHDTEA